MAIILESADDTLISPMTETEKLLIHRLRAMLKDIPEENMRTLNTLIENHRGYRWSDEILLVYLQTAMADINASPPLTVYTLNGVPLSWHACVLTGAMIFALVGEAIYQNGESFSYSDGGISLTINLSQGYQGIAQMMLTGYQEQKKQLKMTLRPELRAIKSSPSPVHIRSYAPRMWVYR